MTQTPKGETDWILDFFQAAVAMSVVEEDYFLSKADYMDISLVLM